MNSQNGVYLICTTYNLEESEGNGGPHAFSIHLFSIESAHMDYISWKYCYSEKISEKMIYCSDQFLADYVFQNDLLKYCY